MGWSKPRSTPSDSAAISSARLRSEHVAVRGCCPSPGHPQRGVRLPRIVRPPRRFTSRERCRFRRSPPRPPPIWSLGLNWISRVPTRTSGRDPVAGRTRRRPDALLVVGVADRHRPIGHHAPVRTWAPVSGKAPQHHGHVDPLLDVKEVDRVAVELGLADLDRSEVLLLTGRCRRHVLLLGIRGETDVPLSSPNLGSRARAPRGASASIPDAEREHISVHRHAPAAASTARRAADECVRVGGVPMVHGSDCSAEAVSTEASASSQGRARPPPGV